MPDMNKILFIRAKRCDECVPAETCDSCIHGFNGLAHVIEHANSGGWATLDAADENANQSYVYNMIDQNDPGVIYGFGHGNQTRYTAQHREDIFNTYECDKVKGRMVYLLSCLTAQALGPMMMEKGAVAYAGFNIEWTWVAEQDVNKNVIYVDPYDDKLAKGFYESANELMVALCNGLSFIEAVHASVQKYTEWINYWYETGGPDSNDCIAWLAHDRDGLVALTYCEYIDNEQACLDADCNWCIRGQDGICQTQECGKPRPPIAIIALLPVVLVVGMVFIAVKK
jgi:hypothetical protein